MSWTLTQEPKLVNRGWAAVASWARSNYRHFRQVLDDLFVREFSPNSGANGCVHGLRTESRDRSCHKPPLLDRRPQRLEGAGEVSNIVPGARAECIGEDARLSKITSEEHNARIEIVFWQRGFLQST